MQPDPKYWSGKKVCVTGGTGFLGMHLARQLLDLGARVHIFALQPRADHPLWRLRGIDHSFGDLCDPKAVRAGVKDCEVVFHTAGTVAVWGPALKRMHAVHVEGTRNVIEALAPGATLVHTSSIVAVGAVRGTEPLTEDSPFNLTHLKVDYVHAKREAEEVALATAPERKVVVVNPGYLIGPEDHEGSVMGRFLVRFWKGRMVIAPPGGFNLVDVRDVARGHLLAAEHGQVGTRYILGGENFLLRDFVRRLAEVAGYRPRALPGLPCWALHGFAGVAELRGWLLNKEPYPSFQHARLNGFHWFCRSDRAAQELGYEARPLADTLADTYRWYEAMGALSLRGLNRWWMRPAENVSRAA